MLTLQPDESVHCSHFARDIKLRPAGTAIEASVVAVIETPLPWPKPVFEHSLLAGLSSKFQTSKGPGRTLASVPQPGIEPGVVAVKTFWRSPEGTMMSTHEVPEDRLKDFASELCADGGSAQSFSLATEPAPYNCLICTQGSHDICCGGDGVRHALAVEKASADIDVVRVSHTGGHRFAPTSLTIPSGRMWAFLTTDDAVAIANQSVPTAELADKCRGWWGASPGPAQVAEIAIWSQVGWSWDDATDRQVHVGDSGLIQVQGMGRRWEVEVIKGREVPTIACNKPGGLPVKRGQEWEAVAVQEFG